MKVKLTATICPFLTHCTRFKLAFICCKQSHQKSERCRVFRLVTSHHECYMYAFAALPSCVLHVSIIVCFLFNHEDWIGPAYFLFQVWTCEQGLWRGHCRSLVGLCSRPPNSRSFFLKLINYYTGGSIHWRRRWGYEHPFQSMFKRAVHSKVRKARGGCAESISSAGALQQNNTSHP